VKRVLPRWLEAHGTPPMLYRFTMQTLERHLEDNVFSNGSTALHVAVSWRHANLCLLLLCQGTRGINTQNKWGQTPLDLAVDHQHSQLVRALLRHGAEFCPAFARALETESGASWLLEVVKDDDMVENYVNDVMVKGNRRRTPLMHAIKWQSLRVNVVLELLNLKANVDGLDRVQLELLQRLVGARSDVTLARRNHSDACKLVAQQELEHLRQHSTG